MLAHIIGIHDKEQGKDVVCDVAGRLPVSVRELCPYVLAYLGI